MFQEIKEMCVDIMKFHFIEAADKGQLIEWFQYVVKLNVQSPECMVNFHFLLRICVINTQFKVQINNT